MIIETCDETCAYRMATMAMRPAMKAPAAAVGVAPAPGNSEGADAVALGEV